MTNELHFLKEIEEEIQQDLEELNCDLHRIKKEVEQDQQDCGHCLMSYSTPYSEESVYKYKDTYIFTSYDVAWGNPDKPYNIYTTNTTEGFNQRWEDDWEPEYGCPTYWEYATFDQSEQKFRSLVKEIMK